MRLRPQHRVCFSALAACLLAVACATVTGGRPAEGTYRLTAVDGGEYTGSVPVILRIANNSVSGKGPVNNWHGQLRGREVTQLIRTRKSGPEPLMDAENTLLKALERGRLKKEADGGGLRLVADGATRAVFRRLPAPPGAGGP